MFLLNSGKFGSDPEAAAAEIQGILAKIDASIVTHRPWQDTKLQYIIEGQRKGLYYLTFFTADTSKVNDLNGIVRLNDNVLRHLIIRHPKTLFDQIVESVSGSGDAFRHVSEDAPAKPAAAASAVETPEVAKPEVAKTETADAE
jgi:small subunit ribosomal protein S6